MTHSLCFVPSLDVAEIVIWSGREFKREFKSEQAIGELHEIEQPRNFFFHLRAFVQIRRQRFLVVGPSPVMAYRTHAYRPAQTA